VVTIGSGNEVGPRARARTLAPLRNRAFCVLIGGYALSAVGDGMAMVAVSWLAISVAQGHDTGLIVGGAVAAYTLPGVAAWLVLGRYFAGWDGRPEPLPACPGLAALRPVRNREAAHHRGRIGSGSMDANLHHPSRRTKITAGRSRPMATRWLRGAQ
jgi:hypothetical protein